MIRTKYDSLHSDAIIARIISEFITIEIEYIIIRFYLYNSIFYLILNCTTMCM